MPGILPHGPDGAERVPSRGALGIVFLDAGRTDGSRSLMADIDANDCRSRDNG